MRILLAGQKSFGLAVFKELKKAGHEVVQVWSPGPERPDDRMGVTDRLTREAVRTGLWIPRVLRIPELVADQGVDLIVAAHSHDFIGRESRGAARLGGIGYHPSLLPRHRGRDAVKWTIHMRDPIAGGSVYWLTQNVDGGPIAAQDWCHVRPDDDSSTLWSRELFPMGVRLLRQVLRQLDDGVMIEVPQDETVATWEPSWDRPPLFKPELPQIGSIAGMAHVSTREAQVELAERFHRW